MSQMLQGQSLFTGRALRADVPRVGRRVRSWPSLQGSDILFNALIAELSRASQSISIAAKAAQADRPLWLPGKEKGCMPALEADPEQQSVH